MIIYNRNKEVLESTRADRSDGAKPYLDYSYPLDVASFLRIEREYISSMGLA